MSTLDNTSIERRLAFLERGLSTASTSFSSISSEVQTETSDGTAIIGSNLYIAYAESVTNVDPDGKITEQEYATGFRLSSELPFDSSGVPLPWIGILTSSSPFPSEDSTDYIWSDTATTSFTSSTYYERYYTTDPGILSLIGNPTNPGSGITWTELGSDGSVPSDSFWLAERYTVGGSTSSWQLFPLRVSDNFLPFVRYTKSGFDAPVLNDNDWKDDVVIAITDQTGLVYTNQKEIGYGTVVVIEYDDATIGGTFKLVSGLDTWVAAGQLIPGDLIVDNTISSDAIQANTITASKIAANTITADEIATGTLTANEIAAGAITASEIATGTLTSNEIDTSTLNVEEQNLTGLLSVQGNNGAIGWGKTGVNDFTNTGLFIGNSAGHPKMNFGSTDRYFYYDGENDILFFTGETTTGPATVGSTSTYETANHAYDTSGNRIDIIHDLPASVTSISIEIVGGGAGGDGQGSFGTDSEGYLQSTFERGDHGEATTVKHYNSNDVLQATWTASGGVNGYQAYYVYAARVDGTYVYNGSYSYAHGESFSGGSYSGTGGSRANVQCQASSNGGSASGFGAGGAGGAHLSAGECGSYCCSGPHYAYSGGDAGSYNNNSGNNITTTTGDYLVITVGNRGAGGGDYHNSGYGESGSGIWYKGGNGAHGIVALTIETTS